MGLVPVTKVRILEELADEPTYGYLLAERLDLSHGYIYTHLKELREEDMVDIVEEREGRKVYGLTENGEYLLEPSEHPATMHHSTLDKSTSLPSRIS